MRFRSRCTPGILAAVLTAAIAFAGTASAGSLCDACKKPGSAIPNGAECSWGCAHILLENHSAATRSFYWTNLAGTRYPLWDWRLWSNTNYYPYPGGAQYGGGWAQVCPGGLTCGTELHGGAYYQACECPGPAFFRLAPGSSVKIYSGRACGGDPSKYFTGDNIAATFNTGVGYVFMCSDSEAKSCVSLVAGTEMEASPCDQVAIKAQWLSDGTPQVTYRHT